MDLDVVVGDVICLASGFRCSGGWCNIMVCFVFVNLDVVGDVIYLVCGLDVVVDVICLACGFGCSGWCNILVFSDQPPSSQASFPPFNSSRAVSAFEEFWGNLYWNQQPTSL